MSTPWLDIVGIGAGGMSSLGPAARDVVEAAEVIIGGERHHHLSDGVTAERIAWPSPFDAMIEVIRSYRGRKLVILVTGDPLWYSVGARILRAIPPEDITFHPQVSAFQLASCRMGWSLTDLETLTVHGRPVAQMIPFIQPGQRLLILTTGSRTPAQIAVLLAERGFGDSRVSVLADLGGATEARFDGLARSWYHEVPDFNTMAVECIGSAQAQVLPRLAGLPDNVFVHDGTMTKREVRAATLACLMPMRGALLWDIGCGCGSVAVEWMRSARDARAIGIEPRADRRALAEQNARALGAPGLRLVAGSAPESLAGLPPPDAVFIGGGLSDEAFRAGWEALPLLGRMVVNAVTLDSEALVMRLQGEFGGELSRIAVQRVEALGGQRGWRPAMPVTQLSLIKR